MEYNVDDLRQRLANLNVLTREQRADIASKEGFSISTLDNYIRGAIGSAAIANLFVQRGEKMLKSKTK